MTQVPSRSSLSPRFAVLWIALIPISAVSCGPPPAPLATPGRSNRPPGGPTVPAKPPIDAAPTRWERWAEVAAYRLAVPRAPSQHLAGDHEGEVLTSAAAAPYPVLGPAVALFLGDPHAPDAAEWPRADMGSFGFTIGGGTSEILRNLIGERVLSLPKSK